MPSKKEKTALETSPPLDLHNTMVRHGHLMFRWRSYLPLLLVGPFIIALHESAHMIGYFGEEFQHIWVFICFMIALSGLAVRWLTVGFVPGGTSGRNTASQRAHVLNTSGMYSIVRNPLYLGNYIAILGFLLSLKVWWLFVIASLGFFIYMERIILAEENYLSEKFGKTYDDWRKKTPVIMPKFKLWTAPEMSFSLRTVLKREYPGLLGIGTAFFFSEVIVDLLVERESFENWMAEDYAWIIIYAAIILFALTLRTLKKKTRILHIQGR